MKRRLFIALSAVSAVGSTIPFLNCTSANLDLEKELSMPGMLSRFCEPGIITAIGKAYGRITPAEYSIKKIEGLLLSCINGSGIIAEKSIADIRSFIEKKIHTDFDSGNTIILQGWVLSVTEARQSALFSLIHS